VNKYVGNWIWLVLLLFTLAAGDASAWWNDGWQYRKKIHFNTTTNGADIKENLTDVPILIRLHTGNFNFVDAQQEGQDIRFVSSDDTKLLKHHIERYDTIDEMALIWVKLPRLSAHTDQDFIWMYYGNGDAMGGQDAKSTFDAAHVAVFHFGEVEGNPQDQSAHGQTVTDFAGGQGLPAVIGNGLSLNGAGDHMAIANSPSLSFINGFTFSAWLRISQPQDDAFLLHASSDNGEVVIGVDGTKIYSRVGTANQNLFETDRSTDLSLNQWHHVMVTADSHQRLTLYLDGLEMFYTNIEDSLPEISGDYLVGAAADGSHGFFGELDEVRLSTSVRPQAWARTAFASQGPDGLLYSFGEEEVGGGSGMPVFYLGAIMKNITLDGWVVIGLLILLMVVSWIVFLSKAFYLFIVNRENRSFSDSFKGMDNPLAAYDPENGYDNSSLYNLYATGCQAVRNEKENGNAGDFEKIIKSFKTALEEGFVKESKHLNSRILVLTLAISGGPFLGLLGTVWGVMNTFAALAAAGEANIMAIAPGVASALSTTVFGLIVAIPALFAYNFLAANIKNTTADMAVFIDNFTLKVENGNQTI